MSNPPVQPPPPNGSEPGGESTPAPQAAVRPERPADAAVRPADTPGLRPERPADAAVRPADTPGLRPERPAGTAVRPADTSRLRPERPAGTAVRPADTPRLRPERPAGTAVRPVPVRPVPLRPVPVRPAAGSGRGSPVGQYVVLADHRSRSPVGHLHAGVPGNPGHPCRQGHVRAADGSERHAGRFRIHQGCPDRHHRGVRRYQRRAVRPRGIQCPQGQELGPHPGHRVRRPVGLQHHPAQPRHPGGTGRHRGHRAAVPARGIAVLPEAAALCQPLSDSPEPRSGSSVAKNHPAGYRSAGAGTGGLADPSRRLPGPAPFVRGRPESAVPLPCPPCGG